MAPPNLVRVELESTPYTLDKDPQVLGWIEGNFFYLVCPWGSLIKVEPKCKELEIRGDGKR
jgi:hypothetical protein